MEVIEGESRTLSHQEVLSLWRRAIFAFSTTFSCLGLVALVLWLHPEGSLGEKVVSACMSYAELMAMLYLGASVIDRTRLVDRVAARFGSPPTPPSPEYYDERGGP